MQHRDVCRSYIDLFLLVAGSVLAIVLPVLLIDEVLFSHSSELALLLAAFEVTGLACCTTGLRGCLDCFQSIDERRHSLIVTVLWFALGLTVAALGFAAFNVTGIDFTDDAKTGKDSPLQLYETTVTTPTVFGRSLEIPRVAMACLGAMLGYYLATLRPPPDPTRNFWFSSLAAAAAYLTAYVILGLLLAVSVVAIIWQLVLPHLPDLLMRLQDRRNATNPSLENTNVNRIADLKQQITWTRGSAAPQAYQNEEVARLQQQIRNLGGSS